MRRLVLAVPLAALLASAAALAVPPPSPVLVVPVTVAAQSAAQSALAAHALELAPPTLALADAQVPQLHEAPALVAAPVLAQAEPSVILGQSPLTEADPLWARLLLQALAVAGAGLVVVAPLVAGQRARHRLGLLEHWGRVAFMATQEAVRLTPTQVDDKAHYALGVFIRGLHAAGIRPSDEELSAAQLQWRALNEEQRHADVAMGIRQGAQAATQAALGNVVREVHTPDPLTARAG